MSTLDGIASADAHGFRVPRLLRTADVLLADGRRFSGRLFLPAASESHAGAMRVDEWLEEPASFFPFLPDGEGHPVILNKEQVVALAVRHTGPADENEAGIPRRYLRVECGSLQVQGEVLIALPPDQLRVLDLLNRTGRFLEVREGERYHYLRKTRVTRVSEPAAPDPSA
jgi:hypothetical protein